MLFFTSMAQNGREKKTFFKCRFWRVISDVMCKCYGGEKNVYVHLHLLLTTKVQIMWVFGTFLSCKINP